MACRGDLSCIPTWLLPLPRDSTWSRGSPTSIEDAWSATHHGSSGWSVRTDGGAAYDVRAPQDCHSDRDFLCSWAGFPEFEKRCCGGLLEAVGGGQSAILRGKPGTEMAPTLCRRGLPRCRSPRLPSAPVKRAPIPRAPVIRHASLGQARAAVNARVQAAERHAVCSSPRQHGPARRDPTSKHRSPPSPY